MVLSPTHPDVSGPVGYRVPAELADLRQRLLDAGLPEPLVMPWTEQPVVTLDRGVPWLLGPAERDPLAREGRTVLPRRQRTQLERLARREDLPRFQRLAVAHELDPEGPVLGLLPTLRRGPRTCTDQVARQLVGPLPGHPRLVRAAQLLDAVAGGAARRTHGALDVLLDPIIFGVIALSAPEHGRLSLYVPLVAWKW